jgi:hypothetical protein
MDLSGLLFDVGDWVTGRGGLVRDVDGDWLDFAFVLPLGGLPTRRSPLAVRLLGAGPDAGSGGVGDYVSAGVTITGAWLGDAIRVITQTAAPVPPRPTPRRTSRWTTPPCPPPLGGWPRTSPDDNLDVEIGEDLEELRSAGTAITTVIFRPGEDQAVLVVAAADVAAVEATLRPKLSDRLCVVRSRWSRAQLDAVRDQIVARFAEWGVVSVGESADANAQPLLSMRLVRVTPDFATWADTQPDGLLTVEPALVPASKPADVLASSRMW